MGFERIPTTKKEEKGPQFDMIPGEKYQGFKEQSILGMRIMNGEIDYDRALQEQRDKTKRFTQEDWNSHTIDAGWAVDYFHRTGGLVYVGDKLIAGETVDSIFDRKREAEAK